MSFRARYPLGRLELGDCVTMCPRGYLRRMDHHRALELGRVVGFNEYHVLVQGQDLGPAAPPRLTAYARRGVLPAHAREMLIRGGL